MSYLINVVMTLTAIFLLIHWLKGLESKTTRVTRVFDGSESQRIMKRNTAFGHRPRSRLPP